MVIGAPLRCSVEPEEAYSTPKSPGAPRTPLLWPLDPLGLGLSRADFWWLPFRASDAGVSLCLEVRAPRRGHSALPSSHRQGAQSPLMHHTLDYNLSPARSVITNIINPTILRRRGSCQGGADGGSQLPRKLKKINHRPPLAHSAPEGLAISLPILQMSK